MAEPRGRIAKALKTGVILLAITAVIMLAAESCATYAITRTTREHRDASGQLVYTMRIGKFPWSRQTVTPLNSQHFPDVEFTDLPPKNDCLHIVFVGDSFIFGDGVDRDSNFVSLVRRWGAERNTGRCIRVFNLGERGTTINRHAQAIWSTFDSLQPDIVILAQYQNDLTDLTTPPARADSAVSSARKVGRWTDVRERFGSANLNLVRLLLYHGFATAIKRDVHYDLLRHWSVLADSSRIEDGNRLKQIYADLYGTLMGDLRKRGVAVGVVVIPSKFDVLAGRFPEESFFLELAQQHQVPVLPLFPLLDQQRSPYAFLVYDGHFNEHGNRLAAKAIYDWLYRAPQPPFPQLSLASMRLTATKAGPPR